jgi:hypothetical protein
MESTTSRKRLGLTASVAVLAIAAFAAIGGPGLAGSHATAADGKDAPGPEVSPGKATVCHKGKLTIRVSTRALPAHEAHGDTVGACAAGQAADAAEAEAKPAAKAAKAAAKAAKAEAKAAAKSARAAAKAARAKGKSK